MKKTPFPAEQDSGQQFARFFPSCRKADFDRNGPEEAVLRLFACLPLYHVSTELLSAVLGPEFPLDETMENLVTKGIVKEDKKNRSYLLCTEIGLKCAPFSKEASALVSLIAKELEKADKSRNKDAFKSWMELRRLVVEKFGKNFGDEKGEEVPSGRLRTRIEKVKAEPAVETPSQNDEFPPEETASLFASCVRLCDLVFSGKDNAAGVKYDDDNMFVPMIVFLERDAAASALARAAENSGVPVVSNTLLAKKLVSLGKTGATVPESCYRDVSLALARSSSSVYRRRTAGQSKSRSIPFKVPRSLSMELGEILFALTGEDPGQRKLLEEPLNAIRKKLCRLLGFKLPFFRVVLNAKLKSDEYRIIFRGLEAGRGRVELSWYAGGGDGIPRAYFPELMTKSENIRAAAAAVSITLVRRAEEIVRQRAPELLGRDEVEALLSAAEERYPVVTGEVKSLMPLGMIREILQSLVSEQVSIRHIHVILETLADWGNFGGVPSDMIIEQIRQTLRRQICMEYTDDGQTLRVLTLEDAIEKKIAEQPAGQPFDTDDSLADTISTAARKMREWGYPPVILCSPKARFPVKEATRKKHPELAVLSYMEIPSDINVEPVGEICFTKKAGKGN